MQSYPKVSVAIGTYNRLFFLKPTIESVRAELKDLPHEIILVDGGSSDGTIDWLLEQKDIITIVQHNRGEWQGQSIVRRSWGYFMNLGFRAASAKYVCMLSDDCLVIPGAIKNGLKLFDKQLQTGRKVGAVAFYWRNWPEQQKYWVGLSWGERMFVNHGLYLRKALQAVDYIDTDNFFFYHADGDLCLRMADAGYACIDSPRSFIEHYRHTDSGIRGSNWEKQQQDWDTYVKRWKKKLGQPKRDWIEKSFKDPQDLAKKTWPQPKDMSEALR